MIRPVDLVDLNYHEIIPFPIQTILFVSKKLELYATMSIFSAVVAKNR